MVIEDDDARFVQEQAPHEVVAQAPEFCQLVHGEMSFERRFGSRHQRAIHPATARGKSRERHERRELLEKLVGLSVSWVKADLRVMTPVQI